MNTQVTEEMKSEIKKDLIGVFNTKVQKWINQFNVDEQEAKESISMDDEIGMITKNYSKVLGIQEKIDDDGIRMREKREYFKQYDELESIIKEISSEVVQ